MKTLAEAEEIEEGSQIRQYAAAVDAIAKLLDIEQGMQALEQPQPAPVEQMPAAAPPQAATGT